MAAKMQTFGINIDPVSYTHLDVYKRQVIQGNHADLVQFSDNKIIVRNKVYFSNIPKLYAGSSVLTLSEDRCLLIANTACLLYTSQAVEPGTTGNVSENTIILQDSPIDGVESLTNPQATSGGIDEETDASLIERIAEYEDCLLYTSRCV